MAWASINSTKVSAWRSRSAPLVPVKTAAPASPPRSFAFSGLGLFYSALPLPLPSSGFALSPPPASIHTPGSQIKYRSIGAPRSKQYLHHFLPFTVGDTSQPLASLAIALPCTALAPFCQFSQAGSRVSVPAGQPALPVVCPALAPLLSARHRACRCQHLTAQTGNAKKKRPRTRATTSTWPTLLTSTTKQLLMTSMRLRTAPPPARLEVSSVNALPPTTMTMMTRRATGSAARLRSSSSATNRVVTSLFPSAKPAS